MKNMFPSSDFCFKEVSSAVEMSPECKRFVTSVLMQNFARPRGKGVVEQVVDKVSGVLDAVLCLPVYSMTMASNLLSSIDKMVALDGF